MAQAGRDTTCDLTTLQQQFPCLECLTTSEKEAAFAYLLVLVYIYLTGADTTPESYRQAAVCFNCEPDSRLLDFRVQAVMNLAVSTGTLSDAMTAAELREAVRCWMCGAGGKQIRAIQTMALCGVLDNLSASQDPT